MKFSPKGAFKGNLMALCDNNFKYLKAVSYLKDLKRQKKIISYKKGMSINREEKNYPAGVITQDHLWTNDFKIIAHFKDINSFLLFN